jgi:hypothetical protein
MTVGDANRPVDCVWCRGKHARRFLCDGAAEVLQASIDRGRGGTLPSIELDVPHEMTPDPFADLLVAQLVVKAGLIPGPGGVVHPALVFTGMDAQRQTLPQWIYPADDVTLRQAAPLVHEMTELAIRQANDHNGPVGGSPGE